MNQEQFWELIDSSRAKAQQLIPESDSFFVEIREALEELEPADVLDFQKELYTQFNSTFHWDVVAAAAIIFGEECDELDVEGFRLWLVSRGESEMKRILNDLDSLAELDLNAAQVYYYELGQIAIEVYEIASGEEFPLDAYPEGESEPRGAEFQFQDLAFRLPMLAGNFGILPPLPEEDGESDEGAEVLDLDFDAIREQALMQEEDDDF